MPGPELTMDERYLISQMHASGIRPAEMARRLGRDRSTIGRELRRNRDTYGSYHHESAHRLASERRSRANRNCKLDHGPLGQAVRAGLRQRWAPEQISSRLKRLNPVDRSMWVSHEAIYQWVYRESEQGHHWHQQLRRRHPRRRSRCVGDRVGTRGRIPGRVGIEHRPAAANDRRQFGHWESDTIEGVKGSGLVVTHVERKSRYTRLAKLADKRAATLTRASCTLFADLPRCLRRTATVDNGKEFAGFKAIEQATGMSIYFANPHAPWERGTNENTNGLLRDWFPKGTDFRKITAARLAQVEKMLNNRPRKCLDYRTPREVLASLPGVATQI